MFGLAFGARPAHDFNALMPAAHDHDHLEQPVRRSLRSEPSVKPAC